MFDKSSGCLIVRIRFRLHRPCGLRRDEGDCLGFVAFDLPEGVGEEFRGRGVGRQVGFVESGCKRFYETGVRLQDHTDKRAVEYGRRRWSEPLPQATARRREPGPVESAFCIEVKS